MALPRSGVTPPAPSASSDARLLVQAQAGGREAREELARRMRGPAYVLALQLVGNREDALDVAQDALLRLFVHLGRVAPDRPLRPWLFAIVRNRAQRSVASADRPAERLTGCAPGSLRPSGRTGRRSRAGDVAPPACPPGVVGDRRAVAIAPGDSGAARLPRPDVRRDRRDPGHTARHRHVQAARGAVDAARPAGG